ncbi:dihydroxy-acid dehydratase [Mameliella sediminis]|nr:dihydroxy-acid dehydratase [Mameliella sediminis]MBY6116101.1 dihydroxy-acid dehydratase [Antarctobacter heliothermus]MBY6146066.1 dihydroxy-acid dehydratase [Mameliella alba]MBV7396940.1 dihydroxy-acid dehydratase [Mameliella sediminis]MBY6161771.1 dihydroxy-acid dehydratase [Mameliella alba]MBY6170241.1 dihydroxy-acid dehydratase [Mameliella alba]
MIGRDSRQDIDGYGIWPWLLGVVMVGALIGIMFAFASPIS